MGDVEPSEVVVEVELTGRLVAQHPFAHRGDDDVEHAVDAGTGTEGGDGGVQGLDPMLRRAGPRAGDRRPATPATGSISASSARSS